MEATAPDYLGTIEQFTSSGAMDTLSPPLQVALFLGAFALLSTALVSLTAFTRIIIVLSFVRRALTTQEIPPNPVVIGMALFLTLFVMGPTFDRVFTEAVIPYLNSTEEEPFTIGEAWQKGVVPLHEFMRKQTRRDDLMLLLAISKTSEPSQASETPFRVLVPAFIMSELKTAFIMGFCIYIPFLLIDLVVSTVLMSLGMMMMPPVMISLPFKILLFVLVDGWQLVIRALSVSFG